MQNKRDDNKCYHLFYGGALEDCLESLALNVSTDFASKNFVLFAKVLRTLLAPRSGGYLGHLNCKNKAMLPNVFEY